MPVSIRSAAAIVLAAISACAGEVAPDALALRGVSAFPEAQVRRALACDLPLLLAGRSGQAPEGRLRELERAVALGYRAHGFRDAVATARAVGAGVVLEVSEGSRSVCGPLRLRVAPALEAIVRRALCDPRPEDGVWDIDSDPQQAAAAWTPGRPVDWNAGDLYADRVRAALRGEGLVGGRLQVEVIAGAAGEAVLALGAGEDPAVVRLGAIRVAGLPPAEAERLRAWLAPDPDAVAGRALLDAMQARLDGSASFLDATAAWEDQDVALPQALLATIPFNEFEDILAQDAAQLRARIRERGRADLLLVVRRVPGAPLPWEEGARERSAILAARARVLERFAAGADVVVEADAPGGPVRAIWSAAHGIACIHAPAAGHRLLLALGDGFLACEGPAGRLRAPMLAPRITAVMGPDRSGGENPFAFSLQIAGVSRRPRLQMSLAPAAFADLLLRPRSEHPPRRSWDGACLVLDYDGTGQARVDPDSGVTLHLQTGVGAGVRIGLQDGAWAREVAPAMAAAVEPAERPLGTVLAEVLTAVRIAYPEAAGDGLARAVLLARSGSLDALIALLGGLPGAADDADAFSIPMPRERRPQLPVMQFMFAGIAAHGDGLLAGRLPATAWPRALLQASAMTMAGDLRAAAAALKPVLAEDGAGPIGCLVVAHAARMVGQDVLAGLLAEAGAARCDAAGLVQEVHTLAGLAPALLPAVAATADVMAAAEPDAARAGRLRALAAACIGPAAPEIRLETAARLAASLGACDWLRARCAEFGAREPGRPLF